MTFTSLQIFVGSLVNFIVIITILSARELRKRSEDLLILNLAVSDFLSLTTALPWFTYNLSKGKMNPNYAIHESFLTLIVAAGTNSILAIAIDRFVAVVLPLRHKVIMKRTTTIIVIILSWVAACVNGFLMYLWFILPQLIYFDIVLFSYDLFKLLAMAILYAIIFYYTFRQAKKILNQRHSVCVDCKNHSFLTHLKVTMNMCFLVCLFYATHLPIAIHYVYSCLVRGCKQRPSQDKTVLYWIYSFMFLNSCINPFVYGLRTKRFKKAFYKNIWSKIFHPTAQ